MAPLVVSCLEVTRAGEPERTHHGLDPLRQIFYAGAPIREGRLIAVTVVGEDHG